MQYEILHEPLYVQYLLTLDSYRPTVGRLHSRTSPLRPPARFILHPSYLLSTRVGYQGTVLERESRLSTASASLSPSARAQGIAASTVQWYG